MKTFFLTLASAREQLVDAVSTFSLPSLAPLDISPWVAMSLLQKAIRRGRLSLAIDAAATLLARSPENLWRRLGGIAFEDIGLADPETVSLVTAALAGKRFRAGLGGEWRVASLIVSRMATTAKCRAADDLLMTAELHPRWLYPRLELAHVPTPRLLGIALGGAPLPERAIALWYALGTGWRGSRHLQQRKGEPKVVFNALGRVPGLYSATEVAREGFCKAGEVLCALVPLLVSQRLLEDVSIEDDPLPPEVEIRGVPGWAYDAYSREGRVALREFLKGTSETAQWVRAHIRQGKREEFLGGLVFRGEGGLVQHRLCWPTASNLRRMVDLGSHGPECPDATELLQVVRNDIPHLNAVRADVC